MKKILSIILAIVIFATLLSSCVRNKPPQEDLLPKCETNLPKYEISVLIEDKELICSQRVELCNTFGILLHELVFFTHADAYRKESISKAYVGQLKSYGFLEFSAISINGSDASFERDFSNNTLSVFFPTPLSENDKTTVQFDYTVKLSENYLRLGWNPETMNLGNFFPILAMFENGAWRRDKFCVIGDPFYSATADFYVTIKHKPNLLLAHSGKVVSKKITPEGYSELYVIGEKIRDFSMVASEKFKYLSRYSNGVLIQYYYIKDTQAHDSLKLAESVLSAFSDAFGAYPYPAYTIVESPFLYGGMEYPNLSLISTIQDNKERVIIHETAHQWWYGLVGSDQIRESYIDEGLATFCEGYYYLLINEKDKATQYFNKFQNEYSKYIKAKKINEHDFSPKLNLSIYTVNDYEYANLMYNRSAIMYVKLLDFIGKEKLNNCLKNIVTENIYKTINTEGLISAFTKGCQCDMEGFIRGYIAP